MLDPLCDSTDFMYPMYADVYYPIITQGIYNEIKKSWIFNKTIICNAIPVSMKRATEEEIKPQIFLQYEDKLIARTPSDIRFSEQDASNATTNILITNIRNASGEAIYKETAGPRSGKGTIYEVSTLEPFIGPFGSIEYYKMIWRRTENQAVGD